MVADHAGLTALTTMYVVEGDGPRDVRR